MLTNKQLDQICLCNRNDSSTCRYLYEDDLDSDKHYCKKLNVLDKAKIDKKVQEEIDECKKKNIDPYSTDWPFGDNCPGFLPLKHVLQGLPD